MRLLATEKGMAMANYRIVGNVEVEQGGWRHTRQIPSFVVEGDVLGIVDEDHAERIAKDIIDPFDVMTVNLTAWKVDGDDINRMVIDTAGFIIDGKMTYVPMERVGRESV